MSSVLRPFTVVYTKSGRGRCTQTWCHVLEAYDVDGAMFTFINDRNFDDASFICCIVDGPAELVHKTGGKYDAELAKRYR